MGIVLAIEEAEIQEYYNPHTKALFGQRFGLHVFQCRDPYRMLEYWYLLY